MDASRLEYLVGRLRRLRELSRTVTTSARPALRETAHRLVVYAADLVQAFHDTQAAARLQELSGNYRSFTGPGEWFDVARNRAHLYFAAACEGGNLLLREKANLVIRVLTDDLDQTLVSCLACALGQRLLRIQNVPQSQDMSRERTGPEQWDPSVYQLNWFCCHSTAADPESARLHLPMIISEVEGLSGLLSEAGWAERQAPRMPYFGHAAGLAQLADHLHDFRCRCDSKNLRGAYVLDRCWSVERESPGNPTHLEELLESLCLDVADQVELVADAAEEIMAGLTPNSITKDAQPVLVDFNVFYHMPLIGTKTSIMRALYRSNYCTTSDSKHLSILEREKRVACRGSGKTWQVYVLSKRACDAAMQYTPVNNVEETD